MITLIDGILLGGGLVDTTLWGSEGNRLIIETILPHE